jgi:hypothetical protein
MCFAKVQQYAQRLLSMRGSARGEMTPMTEDVTFMRGNERIERLAEHPDLAADVARVRRDMEDADHTYAMSLAALRQAANLTQAELARKLGVSQAAVSRIEQPHDLLLIVRVRFSSPAPRQGPRWDGSERWAAYQQRSWRTATVQYPASAGSYPGGVRVRTRS